MFSDYKLAVVRAYEIKKIDGDLSINLQQPTPAKLKDEWLLIVEETYNPQKDDELLRIYFGPQANINEYIKCIKKIDPDRLKPLLNFLKGKTKETDDKNIELLAWLIDFKDRPYQFNLKSNSKEAEAIKVDNNSPQKNLNKNAQLNDVKAEYVSISALNNNPINSVQKNVLSPINRKFKYLLAAVSLSFLILLSLIYGNDFKRSFHKNECMYWNGYKYLAVSCDVKLPNTFVIALDTFNLKYLQKIKTPDTLTSQSVGKTWYLKMDNEVEFFTQGGFHPVYNKKQLKPVTQHIIEKYCKKNTTTQNPE